MLSVGRQPGRGGRSRFAVDRHRRREAVSFPDHGLYESGFIRIVAQRQSDFANRGVDALIDVNEDGRAPKLGGYKMSRKLRESFVGHPSAILFLQISSEGVFQQPRDVMPIDLCGIITLSSSAPSSTGQRNPTA